MADSHDADVEALIAALDGLQDASKLFLSQAIQALGVKGAGGQLIIHIPRNLNEKLQVEWHGLQPKPQQGVL